MRGRTSTTNEDAGGSRAQKRPRAQRDEDEESDVVEASSSLRNTTKRPRISNTAPTKTASRGQAVESSSDQSESEQSEENTRMDSEAPVEGPQATQYELMRDAGLYHLRHSERDDRRFTQRILDKRNTQQRGQDAGMIGHNRAAENGILESIECINFMCHTRLHCALGPLLNFIVGENGSGKSAILTAITLCLGGKASSTNRGGSLKAFIKEGQDKSILRVKIKNQGRDAYQPDLYGESIIVERHFSRSGISGFKIRSALGRDISSKKSEVDEIVEYYCLQVDNPLNVLSQDNARQFLNTATAAQKYKFFVQGVQLQQLDDDYRLIYDYLESSESKEEDLKTKVHYLEREAKKANRMYQESQSYEEMRQKSRILTKQMIWAQVGHEEKQLEDLRSKLAGLETESLDAQRVFEEKSQVLIAIVDKMGEVQQSIDAENEQYTTLQVAVEEAQEAFNQARRDLQAMQAEEREARAMTENASAELRNLEAKVREEENRLEAANGDVVVRKQQEMAEAREREEQIQEETVAAKVEVEQVQGQLRDADDQVRQVDKDIEAKREQIAVAESQIRALEQGNHSVYAGYDVQVPQLLKLIDNDAGSFQQKPIGPIGAHVYVLKPTWSRILEKVFGGTLNSFVVTNNQDQRRLKGMMDRLKIRNCPIIIGNTQPLDLTRKEPDAKFDTILRILQIENSLIRNVLIINHRVEQVILEPSRQEAEKIMHNGAPRNVGSCIAFHDGQNKRGWGLFLQGNAARISTSPIQPPNLAQKPRLQTDVGGQVAAHRAALEPLTRELRDQEASWRTLKQSVQRLRIALQEHRRQQDTCKQRGREIEAEMNQIQEELDAFDGADGRLESLREQVVRAAEKKESSGLQFGHLSARKQDQNTQTERLSNELKIAKRQRDNFELKVNKIKDKLTRLDDSRKIALTEKNQAGETQNTNADDRERQQRHIARQEEIVNRFTEQASNACERVHVDSHETSSSLQKQFDTIRKRLDQHREATGMTQEQIVEKRNATKKAHDDVKKGLAQAYRENRAIKLTLSNRLDKWRVFQRDISSSSRANFMYLLSERKFRGNLLIDHKRKTLDVQVEPDETRRAATGRGTKTLSGGEKSFSSICLLLSIWEAMGSPLRCLDEFDVFMDNVNRAISTNMLVGAARNSVERQYVLITPNAIEGRARLDKDVKIIKLTDPRQRLLADH